MYSRSAFLKCVDLKKISREHKLVGMCDIYTYTCYTQKGEKHLAKNSNIKFFCIELREYCVVYI